MLVLSCVCQLLEQDRETASLEAMKQRNGLPNLIKLDAGTESRVPMEMDVLRRAPEIQAACDQKCEACVVHKATDMWALGLMGHELLTGKPAFPQGLPRVICRMLSGKAPLPWEDHAGSRDNSKELAYGQASDATRTAVLACLARDPANRPSASMLADNLEKLL